MKINHNRQHQIVKKKKFYLKKKKNDLEYHEKS